MTDPILEAVRLIWRGAPASAPLIPAFIGGTGTGKSARARAIAEAEGLPMYTLLPATALPEDILGLPAVSARTRTAVWTLPEWARDAINRPCLIFIDELDKARAETVAALLTLITARTVRDEPLHPGTRLIAAMQPVERSAWLADETLRALSARCVWLPLSHGLEYVAREVGLPEEELRRVCGAAPTAIPPTLEIVSPRQLTAWFGIARLCDLADRAQGAIARTIAEGIGGRDRAEGLLALAHKASTAASSVMPSDMIEAIIADDAVLDALDAAEIEALIAQAQKRGGECFSRFCAALARREQRLTRSAAP